MDVVDGVRMSGPLAPYARGFAGELAGLGFTRYSAQKQLLPAAHVSKWLDDAGLSMVELDACAVDGFLEASCGSNADRLPKRRIIRGMRVAGWKPAAPHRAGSGNNSSDRLRPTQGYEVTYWSDRMVAGSGG